MIYTPRPLKSPSPLPGLSRQEIRCFEFFRFRTAIELAGPFNAGIWNTIVLQAAHSESAIVHAVLALGALHESFVEHQDSHAATSEYAVHHYHQAIERVLKLDLSRFVDHFDVVLMTSIIFAAFESLRGHLKPALTHIASGANILAEIDLKTGSVRKGFLPREVFLPTFTRLENQITEIDERTLGGPSIKSIPKRPLPPLPERFVSISDAQIAFDCLINWLWRLLAPIHTGDTPSFEAQMETEKETQHITAYFSHWCTALDQSGFPETDPAVLILRANMQQIQLCQVCAFGPDEMIWDCVTPQFERLLDCIGQLMTIPSFLATKDGNGTAQPFSPSAQHQVHPPGTMKPTFTFSIGIITPLYLTVTRCRDPIVRRRGMHMLSNCNRKEGIWDSALAASIARRLISIEESGAIGSPITHASQIPAHARVAESEIYTGYGREGKIGYRLGLVPADSPIEEAKLEGFAW